MNNGYLVIDSNPHRGFDSLIEGLTRNKFKGCYDEKKNFY